MKNQNPLRGRLARTPLATAVAFGLLTLPMMAQAFEFQRGDLSGSLDTTVSYGYSWRTEDQDKDLIGKAQPLASAQDIAHFNPLLCLQNYVPPGTIIPPGGSPCSVGFPGSPSQIAAPGRFSINRDDGDLKYNSGDAISNALKVTSELSLKYHDWGLFTRASYFYDFENANRDDLSRAAKEKVGKDLRLLDAFVYKDFNGDHKGTLRLGKQVVSWGESTFIQNGINVINPIDVSKLRVAGAELKEAFLPVNMIWGSLNVTENVSFEGLYMLDYKATEIDPSGSFFSANDFAGPGGKYVMLGFGVIPQPVLNPDLYQSVCFHGGASDIDIVNASAAVRALACGGSVPRSRDHKASDTGQFGLAMRWYAENLHETEFGFYFLNYHSRVPLLSGTSVTSAAANSARYFVEYPEDIRLYGMSWNTTLPGGVAWQGEVSYRPNVPLQVDDVELLFAALSPLNNLLANPSARFYSQLGSCDPAAPNSPACQTGRYIKGWRQNRMSQLQMTFTKAFGQALGADQIAFVGEVGATEVWDLPDQSVLRYEGEGTDTGGGCSLADGCLRNPVTTHGGFPTQFSWGYRLALRGEYDSVFGTSFNLAPRLAFSHDVNGITPGPGGNFLEGRKTLTLGLEANYQNDWVFDLSYTSFFGGGSFNQIKDRDFASFSVKYSF